jgi:phosphopantetheinyl transferase
MRFVTVSIPFFCKGSRSKCLLTVVDVASIDESSCSDWLSQPELEKFRSMASHKNRMHFVAGRIASKIGIKAMGNNSIPSDISIISAKNGRPLVKDSEYSTSISHAGNVATSIVFNNEFAFGIDIEYSRPDRAMALGRVSQHGECIPDDIKSLTVAWALKESLAKAVGCGFVAPFEEFEVYNFLKTNGLFHCHFLRCQDFCGMAVFLRDKALALVHKKECIFEDKNALKTSLNSALMEIDLEGLS